MNEVLYSFERKTTVSLSDMISETFGARRDLVALELAGGNGEFALKLVSLGNTFGIAKFTVTDRTYEYVLEEEMLPRIRAVGAEFQLLDLKYPERSMYTNTPDIVFLNAPYVIGSEKFLPEACAYVSRIIARPGLFFLRFYPYEFIPIDIDKRMVAGRVVEEIPLDTRRGTVPVPPDYPDSPWAKSPDLHVIGYQKKPHKDISGW